MVSRRSLALAAFGVACALAARCGSTPSQQTGAPAAASTASSSPAPAPQVTAQTAVADPPASSSDDMPPLPIAMFPAARPPDVVRAVYTFAARHPEILSHVPCFCGCEQRGHANNDDCFVTSRDARGRVTGWEPHGIG